MKYADAVEPIATSQSIARCTFGSSRSQPKIHRPRNVDSMKNARQALDRERRAEDVADVARVRRPVHAELELLHDAGDDAEREVDEEELPEEAGQPQPPLVAACGTRPSASRDEPASPIVTGTNRKW